MILGGAVAGQGDISLPLILGITWLSAFLGDSVSFMLGPRLGRGFLVRHGARFRISDERIHQVEQYFDRHGGKTIFVGRFIGLVRALAPFIAGSSKMRYSAFAPYSILGTGLWSTALILVGYFASQSLDTVTEVVGRGLLAFGVFVGVVVGLVLLYRFLREPDNRGRVAAAMERSRLLRPLLALARRLRPQAVFLWQRVTPGGLGLELTTLLAVLAVGLFVLISYWSVISGDPGPTGGDSAALDLFNEIRTGWLNEIAEKVTDLGSGYVVLPLAALAAAALAATRRWIELCVLIAGIVLIVFFASRDQGLDGQAAPGGWPGRGRWLLLSQRPRGLRDDLHLARRHRRLPDRPGDNPALAGDRRGARGHGACRDQPRLPAGPLAQRRARRVGARRLLLCGVRGRGADLRSHSTQSPTRTGFERGRGAPAGVGH